jgi:hypothetical protein
VQHSSSATHGAPPGRASLGQRGSLGAPEPADGQDAAQQEAQDPPARAAGPDQPRQVVEALSVHDDPSAKAEPTAASL